MVAKVHCVGGTPERLEARMIGHETIAYRPAPAGAPPPNLMRGRLAAVPWSTGERGRPFKRWPLSHAPVSDAQSD
jgi:hypothetical protein